MEQPIDIHIQSIENALATGEYDQGDFVAVHYDELADLVEQAQFLSNELSRMTGWQSLVERMEQITNRPLHPCLGGKSPYSEFLAL